MPEKFPQRSLEYRLAIEQLRQERGLTREALARAAGVSPSYLSEVERGLKRPSVDVLAKLAGAFGMLPSRLLEYVESLTAGPRVMARSLESPRTRQEWATSMAATYSPTKRALPGAKSQVLQELLTIAKDLAGEDLIVLLDLARHLQKKNKGS